MLASKTLEHLRYYPLADAGETFLRNRLAIRANCNLLDHLSQIDGFFSMTPREASIVTQLPYAQPERDFSSLLDFMAVTHASVSNTLAWEIRPNAMPLVTAGQQPVFMDDQSALNALSGTNTDLRRTVILPLEARAAISASRAEDAAVRVTIYANEKISIQTDCRSPGTVVISQTYYPAWRAYVDGQPEKIWRANCAFQAVQVPPGHHELRLVYRDSAFLVGAIFSGIGLLSCIGIWLTGRRTPNLA
jgi:hypothetical protein